MEKKMLMLTLLLWLMLPAPAMSQSIPLSMMDDSVDDMYSGCNKEMEKKVQSTYFPREKNDPVYEGAWKQRNVVKCAEDKFKLSRKEDPLLTLDHHLAMCVYTLDSPAVHDSFNDANRDSRAKYATPSFKYHSLHFWLASALEILRINKPCQTSYRRTNVAFTGKVGQDIRFGSFASASLDADRVEFGTVTCFYVQTCLGAYLKKYPLFGDEEREVLIPPHETFRITDIKHDSYEKLKRCKTIFVLKNVGPLSNLNCKAARKGKLITEI